MPNYKGHLGGGLLAYALLLCVPVFQAASLCCWIEWCACTLLGSLFPDIDTKSKGQKLFYYGLAALVCWVIIYDQQHVLLYITCAALVPLLVNHRGLLHRFWFLLLVVSFAAYRATTWFPACAQHIYSDAIFFMAGIASHLYLDKGLRGLWQVRL